MLSHTNIMSQIHPYQPFDLSKNYKPDKMLHSVAFHLGLMFVNKITAIYSCFTKFL